MGYVQMWRERYFKQIVINHEGLKKLTQMEEKLTQSIAKLTEFQVECSKFFISGLSPAVNSQLLIDFIRRLHCEIEDLKHELYSARLEWAELWKEVEEYDTIEVATQTSPISTSTSSSSSSESPHLEGKKNF